MKVQDGGWCAGTYENERMLEAELLVLAVSRGCCAHDSKSCCIVDAPLLCEAVKV
jgi:hypothetical protein